MGFAADINDELLIVLGTRPSKTMLASMNQKIERRDAPTVKAQ
jgi:hypothetical protein